MEEPKAFDQENINKMTEFVEAIVSAWKAVKAEVIRVWNCIKNWFHTAYRDKDNKWFGRMVRRMHYEKMSSGKSNNWRKMHGLHVMRNTC